MSLAGHQLWPFSTLVVGNLTMSGITDNIEPVGTTLPLTCTINRIKPEIVEMHWTINGRRKNGLMSSGDPDGDGVLTQTISFEYT